MMSFDIRKLFPRFLLNDREGYAMARAIEAGLKEFLDVTQTGIDAWNNPDKMPEWRLDDLAWEYNIPYDYDADIAIKRIWIREAYDLGRIQGTPRGVERYIEPIIEGTTVQEYWEYGGNKQHFRMIFDGTWTPESVAWATRAIEMVKNVRSILDSYHFRAAQTQTLRTGTGFYATDKGTYQISSGDAPDLVYYADENENMLLDEDGMPMLVED